MFGTNHVMNNYLLVNLHVVRILLMVVYFDSHEQDWTGIINRTLVAEELTISLKNRLKKYQRLVKMVFRTKFGICITTSNKIMTVTGNLRRG